MKLPAEQMSETSARPEVFFGPVAGGSRRGGKGGTEAGSATVVRCALLDAAATGAEAPGDGTVNRTLAEKPANFATHKSLCLYIRCPATFKNTGRRNIDFASRRRSVTRLQGTVSCVSSRHEAAMTRAERRLVPCVRKPVPSVIILKTVPLPELPSPRVASEAQEPPYADPHVRWCGSPEGQPSGRPDWASSLLSSYPEGFKSRVWSFHQRATREILNRPFNRDFFWL